MIFCLRNNYVALLNRHKAKTFWSKNKIRLIIFEIIDFPIPKEFDTFRILPLSAK